MPLPERSDGKFSEGAAILRYSLSLCAGPQGVPDFLSGLRLSGAPVIVSIHLQRHVHGAVPGQVLDLLDVQAGFKQPGDVSVTQDVGCEVRIRQFPLDQLPHAPVRGFRQRPVILHGDHILRVRGFLPLYYTAMTRCLQEIILSLFADKTLPLT